jgi:hypothetical protein
MQIVNFEVIFVFRNQKLELTTNHVFNLFFLLKQVSKYEKFTFVENECAIKENKNKVYIQINLTFGLNK